MDNKRKNSSARRSAELADGGKRSAAGTSSGYGSRVVRSPDTLRRRQETRERSSDTVRRDSDITRQRTDTRSSSYYSGYDRTRDTARNESSGLTPRRYDGTSYQRSSGKSAAQRDESRSAGAYARDLQRRSDSSSALQRQSAEPQRRMTDAERRRRIEQERKKRRLRQKRIKAAGVFGLFLLAAVILIFMTPLFNIKQITLEGNNAVTKDQIQEKVGDLIGKNLFATTTGKIESKVMEIPQVDTADAAKKLFPPSIRLSITECSPAAYLLSGNKIIVIDSDLKIIDDSNSFDTDVIPSVSGVSIPSYTVNTRLSSDSAEKEEILSTMLKSFEATGLLSSVSYISLDDLSNIKFNYNNRIEADCGSQLELERKIRMFAAAISSDSFDANTTGTIDLSVPGTAVLDR